MEPLKKPAVTAFHLYLPPMGRQNGPRKRAYILKGYAIIDGLRVALPNLTLLLDSKAPISVIISESGKIVTWASRPGGTSGNWY